MKHDIFYTPQEQYVGMPNATMCGDFYALLLAEGILFIFFKRMNESI